MSVIRAATEADIQAIDETLYPHLHDEHVSSKEYIRMVIVSPDYVLAVADVGNAQAPLLVGTATLHCIIQGSMGPKGYIDDLVVVPSYRRKGYGERMFQYLEDVARQRYGIGKIFYTSSPRRQAANQFHITLGYRLRAIAIDEKSGTNYFEKDL